MIPELGQFALVLAPLSPWPSPPCRCSARRGGNIGWMAVGASARCSQFGLIGAGDAGLMHAYVTSDFTVINVIENSHTDKPLLYKITGVWGNHEGSMLLWVFILSLCGAR